MYASAGLGANANQVHSTQVPEKRAPEPVINQENNAITKIYLRVPDMACEVFLKAKNMVDIFNEGSVRVIFYDMSTKKYSEYSERIYCTEYVVSQLKGILGDENVVAK
jgi:hypothetical protein